MSRRTEADEFLSYPQSAREAALSLLRDHATLLAENRSAALRALSSIPLQEGKRWDACSPPGATQEKGPEAVRGSSDPTDATNVSSDPTKDTLGVAEPRQACNIPAPFHPILWCPLCGRPLAADGSCTPCKAQFVNIDADVAERVNFAAPPEADAEPPADPPRYREYWDVDELGRAIMCFKSRATGWMVWLACFINYLDHFGTKATRFPYWFCEQRFGARTVQILADLTDDQMKERAAHLPGRITTEHQRRYDSDTFQRDYYWVWMDSPAPWQTRMKRKAVIVSRHRQSGCGDPECRKRHRSRQN